MIWSSGGSKKRGVTILIFSGGSASANLTLTRPVSAASEDDLMAARYRPGKVTNLAASDIGPDSATVRWSPAACAVSYDITYSRSRGRSDDEEEPLLARVSGGRGEVR